MRRRFGCWVMHIDSDGMYVRRYLSGLGWLIRWWPPRLRRLGITGSVLAIALLVVLAAFAQTGGKAPKVKHKSAQEVYDPDKLPWGERPCGRATSKRSIPCACMQIRQKAYDAAELRCQTQGDGPAVVACLKSLPSVCDIAVIDRDHAQWNQDGSESEAMPVQCNRSCTKARCECCKS